MNFNEFLFHYKDYLPNDPFRLEVLRDKIEKLDKKESGDFVFKLNTLEFINPKFLFWFGGVLCGASGTDRILIKSFGLGILKLALFLLAWFYFIKCIILSQEIGIRTLEGYEFVACIIFSIFVFNFWIMDLFLVPRKYKEQNYAKIIQLL